MTRTQLKDYLAARKDQLTAERTDLGITVMGRSGWLGIKENSNMVFLGRRNTGDWCPLERCTDQTLDKQLLEPQETPFSNEIAAIFEI